MAENFTLVMKDVVKEFRGVVALKGVNLQIRPGTVHALIGENGAGKSTLMKIICGIYSMDSGDYYFKGNKVENLTPLKGLEMGVSMIQQELSPIMEMSIAENIFLGREPLTKSGLVNFKKMHEDAKKLLKGIDWEIDTHRKMNTLSTAGMQMVEIVKAVSRDASLIIMDEPTSSISDKEVHALFEQIHKLKSRNVSVIYITHKLDEVFSIADYITVMRDGQGISTGKKEEYDMERLIREMVGRELNNVYPHIEYNIGGKVFEVKDLTGDKFEKVSFEVKAGEIVGFSGLVGAGRTEVARAIFGLDPVYSGSIEVCGRPVNIKHPSDAIKNGIVMASEDRKQLGLVLCRSVRENITLVNLDAIRKGLLLNRSKENEIVNQSVESMNIKLASTEDEVSSLSGGNQQKVVLAKWLTCNVKVIILDEPTRGIDVGAKYEIYTMIGELASRGMAVVVISSEIQELLGICNRLYVMSQGKITGHFAREEAKQEEIMKCSVIGYRAEDISGK